MLLKVKIGLVLLSGLLLALVIPWPTQAATPPTLSRAFNPSTIGPGSATLLTYTLTNGPDLVQSIAFTDTLPANIVLASPPVEATNCLDGVLTAASGVIKLSNAQLGSGESCVVTLYVVGNATATLNNLTLESDAGSYTDNSPPTLTVDTGRPGFSKSFSPSSIPPAGQSTLTFTIDNTANTSNVFELNFFDNLPAGLVIADPPNVTHTCLEPLGPATITAEPGTTVFSYIDQGYSPYSPVLLAGESCTVRVDVTSDAYGTYDNVSGILLSGYPLTVSSGLAVARLDVPRNFLVKSFSDDPVPPGSTASLRFELNNLDRDNAATDIAFSDDLNAALAGMTLVSNASNVCNGSGSVTGGGTGTLSFSGGSLAAEASCTFTVTVQVPASAGPGSYLNTTSAPTFNRGGSPQVESAATDYLIISPAPVLTKSFTDDPAASGGTVTLAFTVTNSSPSSAMTDIAFTDNLPIILATMSSPSVSNTCGGSATFINPWLQVNLTGGSLAAGASCTVSLVLNVSSGAIMGSYLNTTEPPSATVDGATYTGKTASDTLVVVGAPSFTKHFADIVGPGGTVDLVFELIQSPEPPADATNISFTDDLTFLTGLTATGLPQNNICGAGSTLAGSAGDTLLTFSGGTLSPGASCTFTVTLQVPASATYGTHINTTSNVTATVSGLATTGNFALANLTVTALRFSKEFIDDPVIPGGTATLRFTIDNISSTDDATGIGFTDNLADVLSGLTAPGGASVNTCNGVLGGTSSLLIYTGGSVLAGQSCTIEVPLDVPAEAADGIYGNTTSNLSATVGGSPVTLDPASDQLTVVKEVLLFSKTFAPNSALAGDSVSLVFSITNSFTSAMATTISFTDDLEAMLSGLTATGLPSSVCGGTLSGSGLLDFSGGSLSGGETCIFSATLTIPGGATGGDYTNTTGQITGKINGLDVTGNMASADLTVIDGQLIIDKVTTPPGDTTSFNFEVTGPETFTRFSLADGDSPQVIGVTVGVYAITETIPTGWTLSSTACSNNNPVTGVTISGGEIVTCTFYNALGGDIYLPLIFKD